MRRHFLSVLQCTDIGKASGDASRAKCVIADRRVNAGGSCARRRIATRQGEDGTAFDAPALNKTPA